MSEFYSMNIAGLKRDLEKFPVSDKLDIGAFIIFGDVELTVEGSKELLKKVPEFDVILTPEAKSIPIAYEMSRQSGKPYVVARKGIKVYMRNPLDVKVTSITTQHEQHLILPLYASPYMSMTNLDILDSRLFLVLTVLQCFLFFLL